MSVLTLKMSHSWRWVQYGMTDWSMWNLFLPYKECFWKLQNWNFYLNTYNVTIEMVNQRKVYGQIFGNKKMSLQWKLTNLFYLLAYDDDNSFDSNEYIFDEKSLPYWSILQQFCRISFNHIGIEKYRYRNLLVPLLAISHINRVNCLYLVTADSFAEHHFVFTEMTKQIF